MDPTATANNILSGSNKNPPLIEHREIIYEYQYKSNIDAFSTESNKYSSSVSSTPIYATPNRRSSRADTMSLSLVAPNFLIEQIKGTVVDIFGNILDINRIPIPVGATIATTLRNNGTTAVDSQTSFKNIQALERRGIAYHFEINARKDPTPLNQGTALTINDDNYNAKFQRSRFSFDVDKEGQFKLNVPASSESGNIPMLLRAENYSTFATTDNGNPNQLWFLQSAQGISQDIFVDSFAAPMKTPSSAASGFDIAFDHGSITIQDNSTQSNLGPLDRITQFPGGNNSSSSGNSYNIKHGTAYHDILQTCSVQQTSDVLNYPTGAVDSPDLSYIVPLTNIVSPIIKVGSVGATTSAGTTNGNAGGRSGSINLDGSIEFNIGANTVDRQSLWLDTAGGAVINLGRDLNQRSLVMGMDGDAFIQIGGYGVSGDARFVGPNMPTNGLYNGTLDIRVFNGGFTHIIRVDSTGIIIMSPGRMAIHAGQGLKLTSDADIEIDCETLTLQGRGVQKIFGGSI